MPRRADIKFSDSLYTVAFNGGGYQYLIQTATNTFYWVYIDCQSDVSFRKTTDCGRTWSNPVVIFAGTATAVAVWYDKWSGLAGNLIHVVYSESATDDTLYRTIDVDSSDALSTQTVIFAGASTATGGWLAVTRARGGNVYCYTCIDAGAEGGFFRLPTANVPNGAWDAAKTSPEALASTDQAILVPGFAADNQDIMCIFWDASANQIDRYIYDDSANTWGLTNICAATDIAATTAFPNFNAFVDLTNSQIVMAAWNAVDAANQDLLCFTVTESAITAKTDIVTNATDDMGLVQLSLDTVTGYWHAWVCGKTDGSETWATSLNIYHCVSVNAGTSWGPWERVTNQAFSIKFLISPMWITGEWVVGFFNDTAGADELLMSVPAIQPNAGYSLAGGA